MIAGCTPPQTGGRTVLTAVAVSARPDQLRPLLQQARIGGSLLRPDELLAHPRQLHSSLVLLDAGRLGPARQAPTRLARVLICLAQRALAHRYGLAPRVAALVEEADRVTPILLASASLDVTVVRPEELSARAAELSRLRSTPLRLPEPPLGLPRQFLEVFAGLDGAESLDEAAALANCSRTRIHRVLARVRAALGLPAGREAHFRPHTLLAEIVAALDECELPLHSDSRGGIVNSGVVTRVSEKSVDNVVKRRRPTQMRLPL